MVSPLVKKVFAVVEDALREGTQADPHLADMFVLALAEAGRRISEQPSYSLVGHGPEADAPLAPTPHVTPSQSGNGRYEAVKELLDEDEELSDARHVTERQGFFPDKKEPEPIPEALPVGDSPPGLDAKVSPAVTALEDPSFTEAQQRQVEAMVPYQTVPQNCTRDQFIKAVQLAAEGASLPAIREATGLESNMALGPIMTSARRVAAKWANLSRPVAREHFWRVFLERLQVREAI